MRVYGIRLRDNMKKPTSRRGEKPIEKYALKKAMFSSPTQEGDDSAVLWVYYFNRK